MDLDLDIEISSKFYYQLCAFEHEKKFYSEYCLLWFSASYRPDLYLFEIKFSKINIKSINCFLGAAAQQISQAGDKCSRHYVCPPEYLRLSQNCYYFSKNKTTWQDAFFTCQDLHGKFAIIRNSYQDKMLRNFLSKISIGTVTYSL